MKKTLLLTLALFLSTMAFSARYDLTLDKLGSSGWGDCTTDGNGSVTYVAAWTGCGWWLAPEDVPGDFSAYKKLVVNFESLPFPVRIVVEYDGAASSTLDINAGGTTGEVELNAAGASKIKQVYLQSGNGGVGTIVVKEAYFTDGEGEVTGDNIVFDFENNELGDTYASIRWGNPAEDAVVVENPLKAGDKALLFTCTNYDGMIIFPVELPAGKSLDDYNGISFDTYVEAAGDTYKEIEIEIDDQIYKNGSYPKVAAPGVWTKTTRTFVEMGFTGLDEIKGNFDLKVGLNDNALIYFLDNITLIAKATTGIIPLETKQKSLVYSTLNGIIVNAENF